MTRRQMIAFFTLPTLVTSLGIASVQFSGASPQGGAANASGSCCDPTCCLMGAGTVMVAAQAAPNADPALACGIATQTPTTNTAGCCDAGPCGVASCDAPAGTEAR